MKVRANSIYFFRPCMIDLCRPATTQHLKVNERVRVVNLHSAPPCNTMGQCHIQSVPAGEFLGMVSTSSLHRS